MKNNDTVGHIIHYNLSLLYNNQLLMRDILVPTKCNIFLIWIIWYYNTLPTSLLTLYINSIGFLEYIITYIIF